MDVDYLNPAGDGSQVDLMAMMMQMEKLTQSSTSIDYSSTAQPHAELYNPNPIPNPNLYSSNIQHPQPSWLTAPPILNGPMSGELSFGGDGTQRRASVAAMREMIFRIAAMQPVHIDPESVKAPKRRNVRISKDPQSVAARHRRERISERIRILQRLVPGGTKMDTASMLDEAIHYVKFLKTQVQSLERAAAGRGAVGAGFSPPPAAAAAFANGSYSCFVNPNEGMPR